MSRYFDEKRKNRGGNDHGRKISFRISIKQKNAKIVNFEDSANWVNFEAMTSVLSGCAVISKIVTNSIIGGLLCNFLSFLFFLST